MGRRINQKEILMRLHMKRMALLVLLLTAPVMLLASKMTVSSLSAQSSLFARNYTVVPAPQKVALQGEEFQFNSTWRVIIGKGVSSDNIALEILREELQTRFRLSLQMSASVTDGPAVLLEIQPESVAIGAALDRDRNVLSREAYKIVLAPRRVRIVANDSPGLLYGVETLVQLIRPEGGNLLLPEGEITDWPDLQLRLIFWDNAHHIEQVAAFKRIMRQAALFKINAIALKLEGHFQFKSAPALVEPYAW